MTAVQIEQGKMKVEAFESLSNFFLLVGNGDTLNTLRGLIDEIQSGVSLECIFEKVVEQARIQADLETDAFSRLKNWATIASHTCNEADLIMAEDILPDIQQPNQRGMAKKLLVKALSKLGHLEDARTSAGNIKNDYWRAEAYLEVFKISKNADDIAHAKSAAKHINNCDARDEVLAQIRAAKHKNK